MAQWGKVIQAAFRHQEITGYWGNGDFVIALPNNNKIQGKEHLTELLTILRKPIFTSPQGDRFQVTFNCATAEFPLDGTNLTELTLVCVNG